MKKDDRIFIVSVFFVILLSLMSVVRTQKLKNNVLSGAPKVDIAVIIPQVRSGNLSLYEAQFYTVLKK